MTLAALAVAVVVALAATVTVAWITRPADEAADRLCVHLNSTIAVVAILAGLAAAATRGWYLLSVLALGSYLIVRLLKHWYETRSGGITGLGLLVSFACTLALCVVVGR